MKNRIAKISVAVITAAVLLTGCANNAQIKQSKAFDRVQVDNYKTNPEYCKPVTLKLPKTDFNGRVSKEYDITTYDFSKDIDWLLKVKIQDHYVGSVLKTPTSYKITLSGGDGFMTFYYDYKINKSDNSVTLIYRDNFEFRKKGGLFSMKINKVLQEYNDDAQVTFQRLDDVYFYRLKNGKIYAVLYTNVNGSKVGIPVSFAVYPYRGGSKVLYGSNIKYMVSTSSRETFNKKDIAQLKAYIKSVVNK